MKTKYVIIAVSGGFYFFGEEIPAPEGYFKLTNAAMFRKFDGGKGLPGVHRGDPSACVTLDRFKPETELAFPLSAVFGIYENCVDLYTRKTTTLG